MSRLTYIIVASATVLFGTLFNYGLLSDDDGGSRHHGGGFVGGFGGGVGGGHK